jgi:hypothetical protein
LDEVELQRAESWLGCPANEEVGASQDLRELVATSQETVRKGLSRNPFTGFLAWLASRWAGRRDSASSQQHDPSSTSLNHQPVSSSPSEQKVLETFEGKVEGIDGQVAHLTLVDSQGEEAIADCEVAKLATHGIKKGDRFRCTVYQQGEATGLKFELIPRLQLSKEQQRQIRQEIEDELRDYDPTVDY